MKRMLTGLIVLLCCISLVGCDAMRKQDVGIISGGVAGGLIGSTVGGGTGKILAIAAGTIAGALIGGAIGKNMDDMDRLKMNRALERNHVGQPAYWHNSQTGADYEIVPVKDVTIGDNQYCREYRTIANIGGKKQQLYGTACRQPDGSWQAVS